MMTALFLLCVSGLCVCVAVRLMRRPGYTCRVCVESSLVRDEPRVESSTEIFPRCWFDDPP